MLAVFVLIYTSGVFARLVYMLWRGITPKRYGLMRPFTAEEYFLEPLAWPAAVLWCLLNKARS